MNALRTLAIRLNAVLVLVVAGLLLSLTLAWRLHETRNVSGLEEQEYAAELLAHGLPHQAVEILEKAIARAPHGAQGIRLRKVLAEILQDRIGDYERALAELVFVHTFGGTLASGTESAIQVCLNRLGRVYDVQRRQLLAEGKNPLVSQVSSETVIKLGSESVLSVGELRHRLAQAGLSPKDVRKEHLDAVLQGLAGEVLLRRAAIRAGIPRQPEFLAQVRQFEENLALQAYLESEVLKDVQVDPQALELYLQQHAAEFDSPRRVVYSELAFSSEEDGRAYVSGGTVASPPETLVDQRNAVREELPPVLRTINWEKEPVKGGLGPIEKDGRWLVYQVHDVVPPRRVPPQLARQQAQVRLLEQKKAGRLGEKISQLAREEEMTILDDVLTRTFPGLASGTTTAPAGGH